jgi:uncharacterized glyoxalase superfamily protein PhnB
MSDVQTAPEATTPAPVLGGLVAYLQVDGAAKAAELYTRAFGAKEVARAGEGDRLMHLHLHLNGSSLMLSDPFPDHGYPWVQPQGFTMTIMADDPQAWWDRAVGAGLEVVVPLQRMFWGDRYGVLKDSFGVSWAVNGK